MNPDFASVLDQRRQGIQSDLQQILTTSSRFVWEVGCGHGHFLTAYAAAHPNITCVGIDLASERIGRALRKRDRARLAHLHFIRAEARLFLEAIPPGAKISSLFVLFPDPWPKSRHHKHRVLQADFLSQVAALATPDCRLHFRTDFRPYFDEASATVTGSPDWELDPAGAWPFEFETVFQRRAERYDSFSARLRTVPA